MKWPIVSLTKVLIDARNGTWGLPPGDNENDMPVLRSTNIHNSRLVLNDLAYRSVSDRSASKYQLKDGDIIVTTSSGSKHLIGKNALFQQPINKKHYLFSNFILRLRPRQNIIIPRYLHFYLNSSKAKAKLLRIQSTTSGLRNLPVPIYLDQLIPLPSLSEQRRIVEILDQADALRKKRKESDKVAERIIPALFYKMFGDPATNPKGWSIKSLGDISVGRPQYGANAKAINYKEGEPRYVRITDISDDGRLIDSDIKTLDMDYWEKYRLVEGDLLFARSGATVGKTYLYQPEDGLCAFAGYLIRFQLDKSVIDPWVAFAFTHTSYYKAWVATKKRVAAQPNINGQEYASLVMFQPDPVTQKRFVNAIKDIRVLYMKKQKAQSCLENLFASLLHRSFSGDLTAKWREIHMKEMLMEMEEQTKYLNTKD